MKTNKTWKLPKPVEVDGRYEWQPVVRVGRLMYHLGIDKTLMIVIYYYQFQKN